MKKDYVYHRYVREKDGSVVKARGELIVRTDSFESANAHARKKCQYDSVRIQFVEAREI